jgi:putative nucleotidyltransferase with HDIG domain
MYVKIIRKVNTLLSQKVRSMLERNSNNLGTLPTVIVNLLKILNDPRSSAADLAEIISVDQVLSSKLLQLVNSAYFGLRKEVIDIRQAISLIGYNSVRSFTLCISLFDSMSATGPINTFTKESFWIHSISVGFFAQKLAQRLKLDNPDDYFVAGLVHDIGKVLMFQFMGQSFFHVASTAKNHRFSFYEAERKTIDSNHTEIGAWMMEKWKLPELLLHCVSYHHNDVTNNRTIMPHELISLADNIAKDKGIGQSGDENIVASNYQALREKYNINQGWIDETSETVKKDTQIYSQFIS